MHPSTVQDVPHLGLGPARPAGPTGSSGPIDDVGADHNRLAGGGGGDPGQDGGPVRKGAEDGAGRGLAFEQHSTFIHHLRSRFQLCNSGAHIKREKNPGENPDETPDENLVKKVTIKNSRNQ